jgi:hypothetical protein
LSRPSTSFLLPCRSDVDAGDKRGHDEFRHRRRPILNGHIKAAGQLRFGRRAAAAKSSAFDLVQHRQQVF